MVALRSFLSMSPRLKGPLEAGKGLTCAGCRRVRKMDRIRISGRDQVGLHGSGGLSGPPLDDWEPNSEESSGDFEGWR